MPQLHQMEIFYFVAIWKSFTRAALELGVSKGYVSTQITALEKDLKVKLFNRSTRHIVLTEAGNLFFESCSKIINEKQRAASLLKELNAETIGHLNITAPLSFCDTFLAELLPKFQQKYPKISLAIDSSPRVKNLLQHGIDIALRMTVEPDEKYVARLITTFQFVICSTPNYLKQHGPLIKPHDLIRHNCLIYSSDPVKNDWPFQMSHKTKIISVQGNFSSNSSAIVKSALLANQGITRLPQYLLTKEIAEQEVVVLFKENTKIEIPIYAIYAGGMIPKKITSFVSFLTENI